MSEECITDKVEVLVLSWETALVDHKIAFTLVTLVQILLWGDLKNVITHLESNWLHFFGDIFALSLNMAESFIAFAIQLWQADSPLLSDLLEHIWWNGKLRASSIYDCWIAWVLTWWLHGLGSISHSLSFKSPSSEPVGEVLESLEAISAIDNLWRVVSSEESVGGLVHLLGCNTEADHCVINNTIILERPKIVQLLLAHVFVWRESQDAVRLLTESLRLIKCKELEICALILLEAHLDLNQALWVHLQGLDASVVLPDEALQLGRPIRQLRRGLRKDFVWVRLVHVICLGSASLSELISLHKRAGKWVILFELEVTGCFVIAQWASDGQVLGPSIEYNACWLTDWWAHIECSHVHCVVSARQGNLQLQIILIIFGWVCHLRDQLFLLCVSLSLSFGISAGGDTGVEIDLRLRVNAQILIHACSSLHKLYIFLIKFAAGFHRFTNVLSLYLPKLAEVVFVNLFDLDLLIVFLIFFQIFKLYMRYVMFLELNSYYFGWRLSCEGLSGLVTWDWEEQG